MAALIIGLERIRDLFITHATEQKPPEISGSFLLKHWKAIEYGMWAQCFKNHIIRVSGNEDAFKIAYGFKQDE